MNMRYNINPVQRDFAVKHGLFRIERVPYSFADYFVLRSPKLQREAPFLKANRKDYKHDNLYVMPFTETYSSLLWSSSWILLGAVIGVAMLLRPGGADAVDRAIAAIFLLQVIVILSFMGLCQRYIAELFPFLVFAFLIFLRQGKIAFQLRYLLIGLVVVSVVINSLTTVAWLVEATSTCRRQPGRNGINFWAERHEVNRRTGALEKRPRFFHVGLPEMIITRSPLRISLGGGGTDLPSYYRKHGGFLIAAAIDKYIYITVHRRFVDGFLLKYSDLEEEQRLMR